MATTKVKTALKSSKAVGFMVNENDKRLYRVLKIIKQREKTSLPIYFPNTRMIKALKANPKKVKSLVWVEKRLFKGKYTNKPWKFIRDVNKVLNFVKNHHTKKSKTFVEVIKLQNVFSCQMDIVMEELGYCCGHWYTQAQRKITCSGKQKCIITSSYYYRFDCWTYCESCFSLLTDPITLEEELVVSKAQFVQFHFKESKVEEFIECRICHRKFHEICVLHFALSGETYYCPNCRAQHGIKKVPVRASRLPITECDDFITKFLQSQLIDEQQKLTIRLLSDVEHPLKVKSLFHEFRSGANEFTYRNCTLYTFFDTGKNTDICFFSIFFQLYGKECAEPNRNTAYISYIDSVNLLPSQNRTKIYRTILLGLFAYLKKKDFERIFLWSCPAIESQDYIFYMKPSKMKMPTAARLSKWYKDLLQLAKELNVIHSYSGIKEFATFNWKSIDHVPYLEGDMWVTRMEEAVTTVRQDAKKLENEINKIKARCLEHPKSTVNDLKNLKELKKRLELKVQEFNSDKNFQIWNLMKVQIDGFNSQYFTIQLTEEPSGSHSQELQTIDKWNWVNNRHLFVDFFWGNMLEFSSERQAQYSTYVMLHRLFAESKICVQCGTAADNISSALLCPKCHRLNMKT